MNGIGALRKGPRELPCPFLPERAHKTAAVYELASELSQVVSLLTS